MRVVEKIQLGNSTSAATRPLCAPHLGLTDISPADTQVRFDVFADGQRAHLDVTSTSERPLTPITPENPDAASTSCGQVEQIEESSPV